MPAQALPMIGNPSPLSPSTGMGLCAAYNQAQANAQHTQQGQSTAFLELSLYSEVLWWSPPGSIITLTVEL
ncbi:hypothetical protein RRF57_000966 [Xylaria bambusicola]|uniref:Uncharacterized protein n=1 Tax=Xylaria bambusicola TaxID=326684 RepID=A0AAN7YUL4_9PEZI